MADWTEVTNAINQLIEVIDDKNMNYGTKKFRLHHMTVTPDRFNDTILVVAAFDKDNKPFMYYAYVDGYSVMIDG